MIGNYAVNTDFGGATFETEHDAISAFSLVAQYHDIEINKDQVRKILEKEGYYEANAFLAITGSLA